MLIYVPKEGTPGETRVPVVPQTIARLTSLAATVEVQPGLGSSEDNGLLKALKSLRFRTLRTHGFFYKKRRSQFRKQMGKRDTDQTIQGANRTKELDANWKG